MALNLEKQLRFYGAYHHNKVNVAIHMSCVPAILATGILLGTNTPSFGSFPDKLGLQYFPLNAGTIAGLIYTTLYILLEPVAGGILAPAILAATAFGNYSTTTYGATANYWAAGIHIVSWIAQFVGHGVYEGRAPALLDNLVQAIFLAPLFVWLEALFAFGYRPELKSRLDKGVQEDIAKFKSANGHAK